MASLIAPMKDSLEKVGSTLHDVEKERVDTFARLTTQLESLAQGQLGLQGETANLVRALRTPVVRGRWGEMQLRRVVEVAGMSSHCDFVEQPTRNSGDARLRPDMVVHLAGSRSIVVDAKAPLAAYLDSLEADEEQAVAKLHDHARQVRAHINQLAAKEYWNQFDQSPEFVVLFLPGEVLLQRRAATRRRPDRARRSASHHHCQSDHVHRASARSRSRLATERAQRERRDDQHTRQRAIRSALHVRRPLGNSAARARSVGVRLQSSRRLTGVASPGKCPPVQRAGGQWTRRAQRRQHRRHTRGATSLRRQQNLTTCHLLFHPLGRREAIVRNGGHFLRPRALILLSAAARHPRLLEAAGSGTATPDRQPQKGRNQCQHRKLDDLANAVQRRPIDAAAQPVDQ